MVTASKSAKSSTAKASLAKRPPWGLSKRAFAISAVAVLALAALYWTNAGSAAGKFNFQVGRPGPGELAPPIRLGSPTFGTFNLADYRGKTVLLYFQEGLMCPPCWEQIKDIERNIKQFQDLHIEQIVSVTTDPAELLQKQKATYKIDTPVLSDPDLAVSRAYSTNKYGMMGGTHNGHSFIVVGPDGRIQWRADYGGAPDYTMFVPAKNLLADLRRGLGKE
ncbi:peroxiredoxin [Microvirga sp. VF16]|uniref:peroxiredoxin family protein n=1 Tax=Microvirga sp. VF16 TaxID=2807101 RepID=UPI00193C9BB6|nr:peroxiredoxin family protein [Microvirga sp. VF16]QRM35298.1 peroxiredoxin family protein [Microvirga sp. VF16]